ncbi:MULTISPECIES: VanZ family protein [Amniculibacterium]|uniref:VanZ family protein n=1 Tax=Amniculibacterium TaxID=2715289 RepID=UPI000F597F9E|nr:MULTISPECIES: VanZ family protein [Amniculibacterium]
MPIYWAFLTYMLLKPGTENQEYFFMFSGVDKVLHLSIFIVLGVFYLLAFPKTKTTPYFLIMLFYALLTEFLQYYMDLGRQAEFLDIIADLLGTGIAYIGVQKIKTSFRSF